MSSRSCVRGWPASAILRLPGIDRGNRTRAGLSYLQCVLDSRTVRGDIHIQNIKGRHARLKRWPVHFRGVASRYLAHYSG